MSNTNTLRQIGLLIGLAASVAIGAAVVLWLWIPGGEPGTQDYGRFNSSANFMGMHDQNTRLSTQVGYQDKDTSFILSHL